MPQIELKQYADEIARLIDDRQIDAAMQHCRHILGFYPRYLPVYRLLAQASIEKGDHAHATHFLQSLLSADPENAGAWADLAGMSEDLGELEQATWLMERAFEIEPGNADIRERLRDLYKRRDGIDRPRLKLTPGALGRMYATGGFYRRAIHELQRVLESGPGLPPLHTAYLEVGLARAFSSAQGMDDMAEKVCQSLLDKLPNCLPANLMMGQILLSRGRADQAEKHLEIARALDPEGRTAQALFGDRSPIPFERVEVPHLEVGEEATIVEQPQVPAPAVEDTSWLDQVGEAFAADVDVSAPPAQEPEAQVPDWLGEWSAQQTTPEGEAEDTAVQPAGSERVGRTAPLPAWMIEATPEDVEEAGAAELPAWLSEEPEESTAQPPQDAVPEAAPTAPEKDEEEAVELPAWLQELASEAEPAEQLDAVSGKEDTTRWVTPPEEAAPADERGEPSEAPSELTADELPDWLKAFDERHLEEPAAAEELPTQTFDEEVPEWMQAPALDAEEAGEEEQMDEADLPDWLRSLDQPVEESAALSDQVEPAAPGFLDEEELPEWLRDLREQQPEQLEDEEEPLDWIAETEDEEEAELEPLDQGELPEWLRELRQKQSAPEEPLPEAPSVDEELEAEPPLVGEGRAEIESLREDELPEWLQGLRTPEAAREPQPSEELPLEGELPEWLREIEEEAAPEAHPEAVSEELPDWLRELRAQEPISWEEEEAQTVVETPAEEVPDWLAEIRADEEVDLAAEAIDEEALPDWLRELHAQEPGLPSDEKEETVAAAPQESTTAGWLGEPDAERVSDLEPEADAIEGELPERLRALRTAEAEPESAPSATAEPAHEPPQPAQTAEPLEAVEAELAQASTEMPQPVEGMPEWLSELEAEIAGQAPQVLGVQTVSEEPKEPEIRVGEGAGQATEVVEETPAEEAEPAEAAAVAEERVLPEPWEVAEPAAELPVEPQSAQGAAAEADLEAVRQVLEAAAEGEPEPLVEETAPVPEATAEPVETPEEREAAPEEVVEEAVYESEPPAVIVEEEPDWVRELEGPTPQKEPEIAAEAPDLVPAEAAVELPEPQPPAEKLEAVPAAPEAGVEEDPLARARSHLSDRALDDAAREYEQLVDTPSLRPEVLADLEQAVEANPDHAALLRVLGDVYVRAGELQKALRAYQGALRSL